MVILSLVKCEEHLACSSAERKLGNSPKLVGYCLGCIERKCISMERLGNSHQHHLIKLFSGYVHGSSEIVNLGERQRLLLIAPSDDL